MATRTKSAKPPAAKRAPSKKPPWERPKPPSRGTTHLTAAEKAEAKRAATRAGRRYPNLVDNMRIAAKKRKRAASD